MAARIVETTDPLQTEALGAELARTLEPGDIVLVKGELGAGKTTFVRGAARALGVSDPVTSPTFGIGHRYRGASATISHLDLYRLGDLDEEEPELLADYFGADKIAFVEWPLEDTRELADARSVVTLSHTGEDNRRVEISTSVAAHPDDGQSIEDTTPAHVPAPVPVSVSAPVPVSAPAPANGAAPATGIRPRRRARGGTR